MVHTLTRTVLRELICDTIREYPGSAPGDMADHILDTLKQYAPKAFVSDRADLDSDEKLVSIAREMVLNAAYQVDEWEIRAQFPRLTEDEITAVNDLIGVSGVTVEF